MQIERYDLKNVDNKSDMIIDEFFSDIPPLSLIYIIIVNLLCGSCFGSENQCCIHEDGSLPLERASANVPWMMVVDFTLTTNHTKRLYNVNRFSLIR